MTMISWLESLPTATAGVVVVGSIVLLALGLGYVVGKFTPRDVRNAHNDRAGFILAVIGVIYAVLLAFVAIGAWERFQGAEARSYDEAGSLAIVYRDAGAFPEKVMLRATIRDYVLSVIGVEWPRMHRGERTELTNHLLEDVGRDVRALPVSSQRLGNIQGQMLLAMDTAFMDRQARLTVDSGGINTIMWVVLVIGAIVTIAFTYLFGFDQTIMQELMIGGLSFLIGLVLFLIVALDFPFRGSIAVTSEAFRALLESFNAIGR
jgi:Protein of unknown function (DUF4239)